MSYIWTVNPFLTIGFTQPQYFCDRKEELKDIKSAVLAGRNITLFSLRKLGKTGLIKRVFFDLAKKKNTIPIYIDIYATQSENDFINSMISAIMPAIEKTQTGILSKITKYFAQYQPKFSIDPITAMPMIELSIKNQNEFKLSMDTLFGFVKDAKRKVILAIDEFQQVRSYSDAKIPAIMRTYLQEISHLSCIFSGSHQNILLEMFGSPKHPLYQMSQFYPLGKIEKTAYEKFIKFHFDQGSRTIDVAVISSILEWTNGHTYHTQYVCHRIFEKYHKEISTAELREMKIRILKENEPFFESIKILLTKNQWKLLRAIAKEDVVQKPTAAAFIKAHNLGAHSTVSLSLKTLEEKELIYHENHDGEKHYRVYDVFFWRWMQLH